MSLFSCLLFFSPSARNEYLCATRARVFLHRRFWFNTINSVTTDTCCSTPHQSLVKSILGGVCVRFHSVVSCLSRFCLSVFFFIFISFIWCVLLLRYYCSHSRSGDGARCDLYLHTKIYVFIFIKTCAVVAGKLNWREADAVAAIRPLYTQSLLDFVFVKTQKTTKKTVVVFSSAPLNVA